MIDKEKNFALIREGASECYVTYENMLFNGPGKASKLPFFNPAMKLSRDLTVTVIRAWKSSVANPRILDGLAGTGIRGIRVILETGIDNVVINDYNPAAYSLIKKNLVHNNLSPEKATNYELNALLAGSRFTYVDIDPFGSPVQFMDNAIRSVHIGGIIAITATDTAALEGTAVNALRRKYWAYNRTNFLRKELALRILAGNMVMKASIYNRSVVPLFSVISSYYARIFFLVGRYREWKELLKYVKVDDGRWELVNVSGKSYGPVWIGDLYNQMFVDKMLKNGIENDLTMKILNRAHDEAGMPPLFYDLVEICKKLKVEQPPIMTVIEKLKEHGFRASRTMFSDTGIKTDAGYNYIAGIIKDL